MRPQNRRQFAKPLKLHDVYVQPIYAPDEGPPKALKNYIKSWTEFLTISSMAICWFIFFVTYLVDFADDKSFHVGFHLMLLLIEYNKEIKYSKNKYKITYIDETLDSGSL